MRFIRKQVARFTTWRRRRTRDRRWNEVCHQAIPVSQEWIDGHDISFVDTDYLRRDWNRSHAARYAATPEQLDAARSSLAVKPIWYAEGYTSGVAADESKKA